MTSGSAQQETTPESAAVELAASPLPAPEAAPTVEPPQQVAAPLRLPGPPSRNDVVAALIGAEAGAAIGLLWFGGSPLQPIGVTLGAAVAGPLIVRGSRPLRLLLFRHWVRSQLSGPS